VDQIPKKASAYLPFIIDGDIGLSIENEFHEPQHRQFVAKTTAARAAAHAASRAS